MALETADSRCDGISRLHGLSIQTGDFRKDSLFEMKDLSAKTFDLYDCFIMKHDGGHCLNYTFIFRPAGAESGRYFEDQSHLTR